MAASETVYSTSAGSPVVLRRASDQRTRFAVYRSGAVVEPDTASYELLDAAGGSVVTDTAEVDADGSVFYDLGSADLPATLDYGEGYVEVWTLTFAGTEGERAYRRPAILGRFELAPPLGEAELVAGAYPDLLVQLGTAFGGSFQPILDQAWAHVLRSLWSRGTPSHLILDSGDLFAWYRELALARIFGALYAADPVDRWRTLRADHVAAEELARTAVKVKIDADNSGTAEDLTARATSRAVHVNAAPQRRRSVRRRW